jgi:hypothetical protein
MTALLVRQLQRAYEDLRKLDLFEAMPSDPVAMFELLGLSPDDWQARVLRSDSKRLLLNCCRQSGKSTTTAGLAVHQAVHVPDSLVLMASPGLRQSSELFKKSLSFYRRLGRPVPSEAETRLTLELTNGSRIVSLPGSEATVRSYSAVSLLLVDEASRVHDDMLASLRPMLAVSNGRLIAMSTPFGQRGWWHAAWTEGGAAWERFLVPASECSRISPDFLAEERKALGPLAYQSEYECAFVEVDGAVFRHSDIQAALSDELAPLWAVGAA